MAFQDRPAALTGCIVRHGERTPQPEFPRPGVLSNAQFTGSVAALVVAPAMVREIGTVPAEMPAGTMAFTW